MEQRQSRIRLRHVLELTGLIVAIGAALVAYLELRTLSAERLTPYRAVIFTAQFESYRELVRLRDQLQQIQARLTFTASFRRPSILRVPDSSRRPSVEAMQTPCPGAIGYAERIREQVPNLNVALVAAEAVWPQELREPLLQAQSQLLHARTVTQVIDNRVRRNFAWTVASCQSAVRDSRETLHALIGRLSRLLDGMRRSLQFDRINSIADE